MVNSLTLLTLFVPAAAFAADIFMYHKYAVYN